MQQQNDFLLDTCFWLYSAIIFYLTYPIIYPIIWAMKKQDMKYIIKWTGKTPEQINKTIDKLINTPESKEIRRRFQKRAMRMLTI